jgi:uncharacterized protein YozE (UPF0346 family)
MADPSPDSNLDGEGEVVCTDASSVTNVCSFDEIWASYSLLPLV